MAAGTCAEVSIVPDSCNLVNAKWLLKSKSDVHGMVERAKARNVSYMGYTQVEGVEIFEIFSPTASATSNRLVAAMACSMTGI